jgi:hypothetical protein
MVHKQAWSIKNYRYVWDVSHTILIIDVDDKQCTHDSTEATYTLHKPVSRPSKETAFRASNIIGSSIPPNQTNILSKANDLPLES